jgi:acyl-CoA thioesterase FadM
VGRWELFTATGSMRRVLRDGLVPVVAGQHIRYRRPIRRLQTFELSTRVAYWDDKDVWIEQDFLRGEQAMARGVVRLRLPAGRKTRSPIEVMRDVWGEESPPHPAWLQAARAAEAPLS